MSESTPEYESTPENTEPEQPEQPDTREPEQPEPVQPADADDGHMAQVVELHSERGSLTLRPNQKALDETQKAALVAIGIDVAKDPQVVPHIRAFVHMCQVKGLDPWAREAYLIGRGNGDKRKYTMQTGIDGYRKMAASTGRFIRVKDVLWTGADDDDQSYYRDDRGVMRRVWWDQWPASRGYPGAAKVVIEHYDDAENVVETEAVADWGMYAPFVDKWEWHPTQRGKKVYPKNPDGSAIQELTDMWKKGYAHMLAKCLPGNTRIQTDRGSLTIRQIVRGRLPVKVRSVDTATGRECWQPVVGWFDNGVTDEWVTLRTPNGSRGNRHVRATPDHPFLTPHGWVDAGDLAAGDLIAVTSPTLSAAQDQVVRGGLLGDGTLSGRKRESSLPHYAEAHSIAQADYLHWKAAALANLSPVLTEGRQSDGAGGEHATIRLRTAAVPALHGYRRKPHEWLDGLDDLGLAVWFMDDGAIKATGGKSGSVSAALHTCGFGADFADYAVEWFASRGIAAKVLRRDRNPYLAFGVEATRVLLARLAPYLHADGTRKVWHADPLATLGEGAGYVFVPVLAAERVVKRERRFDIEVEGTHTFVVNNVVVHNCAEALAYRKAFPARMSGIYTHEEMHRADQIERDREAVEQRKARQKAYLEATSASSAPLPREQSEPAPAGETVGEVIQQAQQAAQEAPDAAQDAPQPGQAATDPGQRLAWLHAELAWQAEVLGHGVAALTTRQVRALRKNVEDFTDAELLPVVAGLRPVVVTRLREVGRGDEADTYAALASEDVVDLAEFMAVDGEVVEDPETDPAGDPALDADPEQPHRYVDDDGACAVCGGMAGFGDDPMHPASLTD